MNRLKEIAGRLRGMVKGASGTPAAPRPFDWEAPEEGGAEPRDRDGVFALETHPLRPEAPRSPAAARARSEEPRAAHWRTKADVAGFGPVYAEAGIAAPAHGYGIDKLAEMLSSPHLASRPRDVRATAALAALEAAQVSLRDAIEDAVLRHKALAAFEAAKALELHAVKARSRSRIETLQEQVRVFLAARNAEIDALNRGVQTARQQLAQLQARKQREEDRLLRVVAHFAQPRPLPAPPSPRGEIVGPPLPADPALKPPAAPRPAPASPAAAMPSPAAAASPAAPPKPGSA